MGIESLRRLWPPATRWTRWAHRTAGGDGGPAHHQRPAPDYDEVQAQALCDLVEDPTSGITRVTVVCAGPGLLEAMEDVAAERDVALDEERQRGGGGHASLARGRRPQDGKGAW
jgi:hypothetical protein